MGTLPTFHLPKTESKSWDFMVIEHSHFRDDIWDLRTLFNNKRSNVHSMGQLNFTLLKDKPLIIEPIKRYCYLRLGQVKPFSVTNAYNGLASKLIRFMTLYNINSLSQFTSKRFIDFNQWLKSEYGNTGTFSATNLARVGHTLLQIIQTGQALGFEGVPREEIVLEVSLWQWWKQGSTHSKNVSPSMTDRSIPLPIWREMLKKAWAEPHIRHTIQSGNSQGLFRVNNVKFALLIQAYTGLRISEVLYLKRGCLHTDKHHKYWLKVTIEKTEQTQASHEILIPEDIYHLIEELHTLTLPLASEAKEKNYLFYLLSKPAKRTEDMSAGKRYLPEPLESGKYNSYLLRPFLKRNNLPLTFINSDNEDIKLTSHCFRHTFANIAVAQKGIDPTVLQTHFRHLSLEMTMHYIHLQKSELKKSYIKGMVNAGNIYTQGKEGESFKQILSGAKGVQSLDDHTQNLSKMFGINPLPFGLCLYDFKRGHCPHLGVQSCHMIGCGDFITNASFLANFEHEHILLTKKIEHCHTNGHSIEAKKTQFHLQKIETIINTIKKDSHG